MAQLSLFLLGSPKVRIDDTLVTIGSCKASALLFYLAGTEARHSLDHLAALLWPQKNRTRARSNLRQALWLLKRMGIGPWLAIEPDAAALAAGYWCDLHQFRSQIGDGLLEDALALYGGNLLAGFTLSGCPAFTQWQRLLANEVQQMIAERMEGLVLRHLAQGAHWRALEAAQRWLSLDPLHETAQHHMMNLYAATGQRAAALRQVELNLPIQMTRFVGRKREVAEVEARLNDTRLRLLTLTGPGGIGKTRLALQIAAHYHAQGRAVAFVDLQPVQTTGALASAILKALPVPHTAQVDPTALLQHVLAGMDLLLVLDNLEQIPAGGELLNRLLQAAPGIKLLVTSSAALNQGGELTYTVGGFPIPPTVAGVDCNDDPATYDAVRFFAACAQRARSSFRLGEEFKGAAQVCRLVEGVPLSIELAAAWARTLSADAIAQEVRRDLESFTPAQHNAPPKSQKLQAVLQHAWQLLNVQQKEAYKRLSVFRSGFDRHAAKYVAGATLPMLAALLDKSLLRWDPKGRYTFHELLRQRAADELALDAEAQHAASDRHHHYYATAAGNA